MVCGAHIEQILPFMSSQFNGEVYNINIIISEHYEVAEEYCTELHCCLNTSLKQISD